QALKVLAVTADGRRPGACVIVLMPTADVQDPNVPGPQLGVSFTIRVIENPTINLGDDGTNKSAESLALFIARALHGLAIEGQFSTLYGDRDVLRPGDEKDLVSYDVTVHARLGQNPESKCAAVALAAAGGNFTATCTTSGSEIWYTTDGSFPFRGLIGKQVSTALLYTGSTAHEADVLIRAVAYASGSLPSDIAELQT
ncbi:MAG: FN3 associated domain-containing protein, partial [Planctomycetota bacterium]